MFEDIIIEEISGIRAKDHIAQLSQFHRIQATKGFEQAINYISEVLKNAGLTTEIHKYRADGKTKIETWTLPWGWEAEYATLHIIEPEYKKKKIADYNEIPLSLIVHSQDTDTIAEVVYVGEGTKPKDYEGKDVKGKIVLAYGEARFILQIAQMYGALGIIKFPSSERTQELNDLIQYQAFWPLGDEGREKTTFGFSISQKDAYEIISLLEQGIKVKVHVKVKAQLKVNDLLVATTLIEGTNKEQEIHIIADICHPKPGANDNASGSALILEIATTLNRLIQQGKIKRPTRSIRFIWVPEMFGTVAYMEENQDVLRRTICTINADMVGQNQFLCRSKLNFIQTPMSLPSFINSLVAKYVRKYSDDPRMIEKGGTKSPLVYRIAPYSGGSDHFIYDDATIGIPAVMLLQWPDIFYHSTLDTVDKSDSTALKWIGSIIAVSAYEIATADENKAIGFVELDVARIIDNMYYDYLKIEESLKKKNIDIDLALKYVDFILDYGYKSIDSIKHLTTIQENFLNYQKSILELNAEKLKTLIKNRFQEISQKELDEFEQQAAKIKPVRKFRYPLNLFDIIQKLSMEEKIKWSIISNKDRNFHNKVYELCNFMDGTRSLLDIIHLLRFEFNDADAKTMLELVKTLKRFDLVLY